MFSLNCTVRKKNIRVVVLIILVYDTQRMGKKVIPYVICISVKD